MTLVRLWSDRSDSGWKPRTRGIFASSRFGYSASGQGWGTLNKSFENFGDERHSEIEDTVADKLAREAQLVAMGLVGGIKDGAGEFVDDPLGSGLRLAGSVGLGLTLGYMQRGAGLLRFTGQIAGASIGTAFLLDVAGPGRWDSVGDAFADTWHSKRNMDRNVSVVQRDLGRFAFDSTIMTAAGLAGAKAGERFFVPRATPVSEILGELGRTGSLLNWKSPVRADLAKAFEFFPHKAKGHIETGKDAIVIELTNERILKILNKPLPVDAGKRFFDIPILEQGSVANGRLQYIVQPKAVVNTSKAAANEFAANVRKHGYNFWDFDPTQLGYYKGSLKLLDYDAVSKLTLGV